MPWLKLLHISAVTVWCAALLYLPLAVAAAHSEERLHQRSVLRMLFTNVATPAALLAIASGTAIFLLRGPQAPWLVAKLVVVGLVVLMHASLALLVLRSERGDAPARCWACSAVFGTSLAGLSTVAWLVLAKPLSW